MTNKKKKMTPEIRFSGFEGDWEQCKLGEVVKIVMGQSPNSENYTNNPSDSILVQGNADMKNGRVVPRVWTTQITKKAEKNDLILSVRAPVGVIGKTDYNIVIGRGVAAIKGNEFIFQLLGKMNTDGYWNKLSTGSTFESINSTDINYALINIPSKKEQQKIGNFFKKIDDTITLHQQKLEMLRRIKQAFLQQLFPAKEENVPKVRFANFEGVWEQCKLENLTDFFSGLTYSPDNVQENGTLVLRSSNVKNNTIVSADNVYVSNEVATSEQVHVGDVIVVVRNGSRSLIGKHASVKHEMPNTVIGAFMTGLRSPSPKFLTALLDTQQFCVEIQKNLGATINQITTGEFKKMKFVVPTDEVEKEKIGSFFHQIDETITLHQQKLEMLRQLKQAYLQKMFV